MKKKLGNTRKNPCASLADQTEESGDKTGTHDTLGYPQPNNCCNTR